MLKGIDVSGHQGDVDWNAMARAGIRWAGVKATEGQDYFDPRFSAARVNSMRDEGIALMPYHYLRFRTDRKGSREAEHFLSVVEQAGWEVGRDLPLSLDAEWGLNEVMLRRLGPDGAHEYASSFCAKIHEETGRGVVTYLSPAFVPIIDNRPPTHGEVSWVAAWDAPDGRPPTPRGFSAERVLFHQTSATGSLGGESPLDLDVFLGDEDALEAFIKGKDVPKPNPGPKPSEPDRDDAWSIEEVQKALNEIGWRIRPDGEAGPQTERAVRAFQRGYALGSALTIDGDVGSKTEAALERVVKADGRTTEHFWFREFRSRKTGWIEVHRALPLGLEKLREISGPIGILSAYRDYEVSGQARMSQHKFGNAIDPTRPLPHLDKVKALRVFSGIGYSASTRRVRHVDVRHVGPNTTNSSPSNPMDWKYTS